MSDLPIVIFANRKDYFFTKICITSIRYFYPDNKIYLVKDNLNGPFCTKQFRKMYGVAILKLSKKYFGWSAAKIHFLLDKKIPVKRYLCLDSDIVFLGKVLDKFEDESFPFVVHPAYVEDPHTELYKNQYIDVSKVNDFCEGYSYPGYFFNAGQTIVTPGIITTEHLKTSFNPSRFPYYLNQQFFKTVDQSILNAVFPTLKNKVGVSDFVVWSGNYFNDKPDVKFEKYASGETKYLLHYAGDLRTYQIDRMKGRAILSHYKEIYLNRMPALYRVLDSLENKLNGSNMLSRFFYILNKVKIKLFKL